MKKEIKKYAPSLVCIKLSTIFKTDCLEITQPLLYSEEET
jgi:hypothetical protein